LASHQLRHPWSGKNRWSHIFACFCTRNTLGDNGPRGPSSCCLRTPQNCPRARGRDYPFCRHHRELPSKRAFGHQLVHIPHAPNHSAGRHAIPLDHVKAQPYEARCTPLAQRQADRLPIMQYCTALSQLSHSLSLSLSLSRYLSLSLSLSLSLFLPKRIRPRMDSQPAVNTNIGQAQNGQPTFPLQVRPAMDSQPP
jgi:hypothetical protein